MRLSASLLLLDVAACRIKHVACCRCPAAVIHPRPVAGGQASNVATFVAHGDVALSVLMTAGKRAAEGG